MTILAPTFSGLSNVTVPATVGGLCQVNLSDRAPSNGFMGDVISMAVLNCGPATIQCSQTGPYIQLIDANALASSIITPCVRCTS